MATSQDSKSTLRKQLRAKRRALSQESQRAAAEAVANHIAHSDLWHSANKVALYLATDGELDPGPLTTRAREASKVLCLPAVLPGKDMEFRLWETGADLSMNHYGIAEPAEGAPMEPDLICLPLVGWSRSGARLGMGGGYYDRFLAKHPASTTIGLAHAMQELDSIPSERWDMMIDYVATEDGLWNCHSR